MRAIFRSADGSRSISSPPAAWIAKCGPLVQYKSTLLLTCAGLEPAVLILLFIPIVAHEKGGHFPALDNPEGLMGDLREFAGAHWKDRK